MSGADIAARLRSVAEAASPAVVDAILVEAIALRLREVESCRRMGLGARLVTHAITAIESEGPR